MRSTFPESPDALEIELAAVANKSKAKNGLQTAMKGEIRIVVRYSQRGIGICERDAGRELGSVNSEG